MRRSNAWLPIGILAVLAATSFWLKSVVENTGGAGRDHGRHDPDLIVAGFSVHQLDTKGRPRYTLSARRMLHFPDDDGSSYEGVGLTAFAEGQPPIHVVADAAERAARDDRVVLTGKVRAEQAAATTGGTPLTLTTDRLDVYPDARQAVAPGPVVLTQGADRLEADTMSFDLKLSTVRFTRAKVSLPPAPR